jgi:hypothetical protein
MSPFKATITTSLGHHYLDDLASSDPDCIIIWSTYNLANDPHLPDDTASLHFTMAEATDDSYIVALTFPALQCFTLAMECFQFIYGWLTLWEKPTLHILNSPGPPLKTLPLQSIINAPGIDPWMITLHQVPVSTNKFNFLCTQVDDPKTRYLKLVDAINSSTFPAFSFHTPFMLLHSVLRSSLVQFFDPKMGNQQLQPSPQFGCPQRTGHHWFFQHFSSLTKIYYIFNKTNYIACEQNNYRLSIEEKKKETGPVLVDSVVIALSWVPVATITHG